MPDKIKVGMADWKLARDSDVLVTFGLGSCVALSLWNSHHHVAAMAHVMLPDSKLIRYRQDVNLAKFADTALEAMLAELKKQGFGKESLQAKLVGGANMFTFTSRLPNNNNMNVGQRNVVAAKEELAKAGIPLVAEDTGGTTGRSVEFFADSGVLRIRTAMFGEKDI